MRAALFAFLATAAVAQSFTATGSLVQARAQAATAVLSDGTVLLAGGTGPGGIGPGGIDNAAALSSAEIYDPATGDFHSTGSLLSPRSGASAARLANGMAWIVGGELSSGVGASTELYDPASGAFAAGPSLPHPLQSIALVAVPDGDVLVFGQTSDCTAPNCVSPVYKFDPASGRLSSDGQLQVTRNNFTATLLPTGKVLVVSGWAGNSMATSPADSYELFDPASGTSVLGNAPQLEAALAASALLPTGHVLICGGGNHDTGFSPQCFLYDPAANAFSPTGSMASGRNHFALLVLPDGRALALGGTNHQAPDAEVYDPALGTFSDAGNFLTPRIAFSATLLGNGKVLVAGGDAASGDGGAVGAALSSAELFRSAAPTPGFSLTVNPAQAIVASGTSARFTISAVGANGFNASIALSCSQLSGPTCSFNPGTITPGGSSTLTLGNLDVAKGGVVAFQITGSSGAMAETLDAQANLEPPVPLMAPASLNFGSAAVGGKSAAQTITLANSGESPLQISAITASGDFTQTNNCPASLVNLGNPTCTITVTFAPTASGNRTGSLAIADNAPFSPQTVPLSGLGTDPPTPVVSINPTSLTYGSDAVGVVSPAFMVTLSNTGTANLVIGAIATSGDFAQTNNCGGILSASQSCIVSVTFVPTASGARTGQLTFTDSAAGSPQVVPLIGTGAGATGPTPSISLLPALGGSATTAVNAGQTASFPLSLSGVAGFVGTVTLACAGAPAGAACTTNPATVAVGSAIIPVAVTVTTTAAAAATTGLPPPSGIHPSGWWLLLVFASLMTECARRRRTRHRAVALLLAVGLAMAACGGNSSPAPLLHSVTSTPAGTYTLTVTATSDGAPAGQTQVTLVVH